MPDPSAAVPNPGPATDSAPKRALLSRRNVQLAAGVAAVALAGAGVFYLQRGTHVTLAVDATQQELTTKAGTVHDLLADQQITLGERDLVAPALDTALSDGEQVVVRYARPLTVSVDGATQTYWTTELTLDKAVSSLGIRAEGARWSVSRSLTLGRDGSTLALYTPKQVRLTVAGKLSTPTSTAATVADLLTEQHVTQGPDDEVTPPVDTAIRAGLAVRLVRVTHRQVAADPALPAPMTQVADPTTTKGTRTVVKAGVAGAKHQVWDVTYADGRERSRRLVSDVITKQPVAGSVKVGTKPAPVSAPSTGSGGSSGGTAADRLNWAALAKCESGGNPRAVNKAGYYGLYQFSLATWRSVGGTGNPINASPAEQLMRAKILYNRYGAGQWGCGRHLFD